MKLPAVLACAVSVLAAGQALGARCVDDPHMKSPDAVIAACTAEIQKGVGARVDLSTDYVARSHAYSQKGTGSEHSQT